jgi:RNA polymerase sigma-70 factor (ECF subfamily)
MIAEAEQLLTAAEKAGRMGRFQLEAAIQSVHARRAWGCEVDWEAIALLYEGLVRLAPSIGAVTGRAAAIAEARGCETGWSYLQAIPNEAVKAYQPYWALAAHLLKRMGRSKEADAAFGRAIGLCEDPAVRDFLTRQMSGGPLAP